MKKCIYIKPYMILFLILFTLIGMSIFSIGTSNRIRIQSTQPLDENWVFDNQNIVLPAQLNIEKDQTYQISKVLPDDFEHAQTLLIRTSLQNLTVYLDNQIVYQRNLQEHGQFPPMSSLWHFVELPGQIDGETLTLEFSSPYVAMSGDINEITYGNQAELIWSIAATYGYRLIVGIFVIMVGLIMVIVSLIRYKMQFRGNVYVGYFLVTLALWIIAESRMIQFFTGNQMIIGSLAYIILALMPISLTIFVRDYIFEHAKLRYTIYLSIVIINALLVLLMHALSILDFFESVAFTLAVIFIGFVMTLYTAVSEVKKYQNQYAKTILNAFILLMFFTTLEIINYFTGNFGQTSLFALTGIGILSLLLLINYIKYLVERLKVSYQSELYKKLAYTDHLTQGSNRMAFERDMDIYFGDIEVRKQMSLILFDLDNLKTINDIRGHAEGDKAMVLAFTSIQDTFGQMGHCYRIGGDEFACIALDGDETLFKVYDEQLKQLTQSLDENFRISFGYAKYNHQDIKASDLIKRADEAMYLNKCNFKDNCKRLNRST